VHISRIALSATIGKLLLAQSQSRDRNAKEKTGPLVLISPSKVALPACDGSENILMAVPVRNDSEIPKDRNVFLPKGRKDFTDDLELLTNANNKPTPATFARVYQLQRNATFREMMKQLGKNPRKLCFTEHQVIVFAREHPEWLVDNNGYSTFFLVALKTGKIVVIDFVFDAEVAPDKFEVFAFDLTHNRPWNANSEDAPAVRRLVVLAPPKKQKSNS